MDLRARYDPNEDRMLLELCSAAEVLHAFGWTRRQWLALLNRVRGVLLKMGESAQAPSGPMAPTDRRRASQVAGAAAQAPVVEPLRLDDFRLRTISSGLRLTLVAHGLGTAVDLQAAGLQQLDDLLTSQAERAGWDPEAAMGRLKAAAMARAAVVRAGARPDTR